ncbi:MAG: GNAT family N-acetyltransferase [Acidobacteriota bacterium]
MTETHGPQSAASDELVWFDGADISESSPDWLAAKAIRIEVFVEEQDCPWAEEFDAYDGDARHVLIRRRVDGQVHDIGTARWRVVDDDGAPTAKLERFAVRSEYRGGGIGQALVNATLADAQDRGLERFVLHAQEYLVDFYRAFRFLTVGARFIEAGIAHRRMVRDDRPAEQQPQ